ncbi:MULTISPECIES: magnesium transporter CorA family protein [Planococcus]|uniref:Magnesium transporter CorA n=2 Tax=Planococcus TaxID=1372 RepID=A0ABM5WVX1_9BACL|nr:MULTISPECIES: magnesium transporter CorA family protein [Planococcus]ALS78498.1 magnesium transporter CorA [Planococcus kocurii]AQU79512.1 magnesium transporter CorA [Planococcus faecalis]MDJ0332896.1 magnesium transporter CorA family protein [Planococcus sp. S3-L1]OHX51941.1 magnesium transporter CorA [Planococcus faecalis]
MLTIYKSSPDGILKTIKKFESNCWINITAPSKEELEEVSRSCKIPMDFLEDPLDLEESARIEYDEETNSTLLINDFPIVDVTNDQFNSYITIPIGIILGSDYIVTVCQQPSNFLNGLIKKNVSTLMKSRFALEVLLSISTQYLDNLKHLNKHRLKIESNLRDSLTNKQLYDLMEIEKSLVYFLTSLKSNATVITKLFRIHSIKLYEDDKDLLEDVKIENNQGIETTELYTRILDSITSSYSSLISNELNNTMKTLTLFTVFLTLPTLVFSFYGMNVDLPAMGTDSTSWVSTLLIALILVVLIGGALWKRRIF